MTKIKAALPNKDAPSGQSPFYSGFGLDDLQNEVDRLFRDFDLRSWLLLRHNGSKPTVPGKLSFGALAAMDIVEKEREFLISAELPGLDDRDVEVSLANGVLTIKGEKKEEKEEKKKNYYLSERRYGAFERHFPLPQGIDTAGIHAAFRKGVLKVRLPKLVQAQKPEKKIAISSA